MLLRSGVKQSKLMVLGLKKNSISSSILDTQAIVNFKVAIRRQT